MKTIKILFILLFLGFTPIMAQKDSTSQKADDEELNLPEGMQENTDSLINAWNMSKFFQLDTTSQLADINPYFEKAVYIDRLKRIPSIMELSYNDIVQKYIDQYTGRLRHSVSYMLGASNFYVPIMEEALSFYHMPLELKYLPVIESAFNPRARSHAGATGLWQFMTTTGKRYGLEVNSLVDERCDPIKASYAAARYMKDLYDIFGDWTLVIAAYNCGPNNINKAIHRSGGERNYWKIYPYLPRETRGYVPAFIAANYVMNFYNDHNILPMHVSIPTNTDTIIINRDVTIDRIAQICNIDNNELRALNPQYTTSLIPGYRMKCTLRMPQKQLLTFIDLQDSIFNVNAGDAPQTQTSDATPEIEQQETTVKTHSYSRHHSSSRSSRRYSSRHRTRSHSVTIGDGQTLSEIAEKHHTTVSKLRKLNKIKGSSIRAGKKIRVK